MLKPIESVFAPSLGMYPLGSVECLLETGPCCRCCGRRNMERMGKNLYRCQHTGETGELHIRDGFPVLLPLRQVEK
jgi:hypothetical protein